MSALNSLNHHFAIPNHLEFIAGPDGRPLVRINNRHASSDIALHGAHVLSFIPHSQPPVIWLSETARTTLGKPIHSGIPVCWPWFGDHADFPPHGFARCSEWKVISSDAMADGATRIAFGLLLNKTTRTQWQWPHAGHLRLIITVGATLTVELLTENTGDSAFVITEALHTYLAVSDIENIVITGLADCDYLDKVEGMRRYTQTGDITVHAEIDRVYLDTAADIVVEDRTLGRRLRIAKSGSLSTVVWNPWAEKSAAIADMGAIGYRTMICVESANAASNIVSVAAGETHSLRVVYSVETV
jgi:glucose-6-phosphate 1-epimerase